MEASTDGVAFGYRTATSDDWRWCVIVVRDGIPRLAIWTKTRALARLEARLLKAEEQGK